MAESIDRQNFIAFICEAFFLALATIFIEGITILSSQILSTWHS